MIEWCILISNNGLTDADTDIYLPQYPRFLEEFLASNKHPINIGWKNEWINKTKLMNKW